MRLSPLSQVRQWRAHGQREGEEKKVEKNAPAAVGLAVSLRPARTGVRKKKKKGKKRKKKSIAGKTGTSGIPPRCKLLASLGTRKKEGGEEKKQIIQTSFFLVTRLR